MAEKPELYYDHNSNITAHLGFYPWESPGPQSAVINGNCLAMDGAWRLRDWLNKYIEYRESFVEGKAEKP